MNDKRKENILVANLVYPEPANIFKSDLKSLDDIKQACCIVFDTNVLLLPYTIGSSSFSEITKLYRTLSAEKRIFIPGQVAREFANNRPLKICEIYKQLLDKKSKLDILRGGKYPLLEEIEEYKDNIKIEKEIAELNKKYKENIDRIISHIKSWNWNDPVSLMYNQYISEECIIDLEIDIEDLLNDLKMRQVHKIPPGYKDSSKGDKGIGDLLIWKTILHIGKQQNNDIIFVSGDLKADWWYGSNRQNIYPRYELIDEFRRFTKGKTIHIVEFSTLLNLLGVAETIVKEVRNVEIKLKNNVIPMFKTTTVPNQIDLTSLVQIYPNLKDYQIKVIHDIVNYFLGTYAPIDEENFDYEDESLNYIHIGSYLTRILFRRIFGDVSKSILDKVDEVIGSFGTTWVKKS